MYMTSFKSTYVVCTVDDEQQRVFKNSNEDPDFSIFFSTYESMSRLLVSYSFALAGPPKANGTTQLFAHDLTY